MSSLAINLRRAIASDVGIVKIIHQEAISEICSRDYAAEVIRAWLAGNDEARYLNAIRDQSFWIVEEAGGAIGFGGVRVPAACLESLFIRPAALGRGIGRQLLNHMEAVAMAAGVRRLHLKSSLTAQQFYGRNGFQVVSGDGSIRLASGVLLQGIPMAKILAY